MIQEDNIIKALQATNTNGFIGDDAAVLTNSNVSNRYVISKDLLIKDVHFRATYCTPEDLAHKAPHVNLSDIATMGAEPLYILCKISIPSNLQACALRFLNSFLICIIGNLGLAHLGFLGLEQSLTTRCEIHK